MLPCASVGSVDVYQLLAGRDYAVPLDKTSPIGAQIAAQMGNYVYILADRTTKTAIAIGVCDHVK